MSTEKKVFCQVSKKEVPITQAVQGDSIRTSILNLIKTNNPNFDENGYVSIEELNKLRTHHVKSLLEMDKGELSKLDHEVLESMQNDALLSKNLDNELNESLSFGQRIADKIAEFGGSWRFIISFGVVLLIWILINTIVLVNKPFDPYPFILLNLCLSCIAALQAPVIMMSQNRMEEKDRQRAANDYKINLKAELEIRLLHEKMDHLIVKQMDHLNEIQQIQIDLLNEISQKKR